MQKCASAWPRSSPTYKFDVNENSDCYLRYPAFSQTESGGKNALQENDRRVNFQPVRSFSSIGAPIYIYLYASHQNHSTATINE
jgi:hypothetical protein